jgi:hypothetical protein
MPIAVQLARQPAAQVDDLLQRRHLVAPVVDRVLLAELRDSLLGPKGLQLGEREVLGEPARQGETGLDRLRRPPVGELGVVLYVGRLRDLVLVPGHEHAVLRDDQVRLDVVRAHARAEGVGGQRVLGPVAGGAAVGDHEGAVVAARRGFAASVALVVVGERRARQRPCAQCEGQQQQRGQSRRSHAAAGKPPGAGAA